jgi:hypothetical protein
MPVKIFVILILNIPLFVYSQNNLKGIVLDSINHQPVPFATVYINGTSKGTYTDSSGNFNIKNVITPCQVIVSQVGYKTKMTNIDNSDQNNMTILLNANTVHIKEIVVESNNLRKKNFNDFKYWFIGSDRWGKSAILKNDSSLIFNRKYNNKKVTITTKSQRNLYLSQGSIGGLVEWGKDSSYVIVKELISLKVTSNSPLIIDLPLLGYTLHVDLADFLLNYNEHTCTVLGYYYFQPYIAKNEKDIKKYLNNRQTVFFNSCQHFCRSLYSKELEQNGYKLVEQTIDEKAQKRKYRFVNIDTCVKYNNSNRAQIIGLKNKNFDILYYFSLGGKPKDLTINKKGFEFFQSAIYFLNDTCIIRSDGTIPDNNIMFGGEISEKKAGAMLPDDYNLNEIK